MEAHHRAMLSVPKERFRSLLSDVGRRMGLTASAIDQLARSAQLARWSKGQNIFSPEDTVGSVDSEDTRASAGTVCRSMEVSDLVGRS